MKKIHLPVAILLPVPPLKNSPSDLQLQFFATQSAGFIESTFASPCLERALEHTGKRNITSREDNKIRFGREILLAGKPNLAEVYFQLVHLHCCPSDSHAPPSLIRIQRPRPLSVQTTKPRHVKASVPHNYRHHSTPFCASCLLAIHPNLASYISTDKSLPIISITHGLTFILVELSSLEALSAVQVSHEEVNIDPAGLDKGWASEAPIGIYMFAMENETEGTVRARMMVRGMEDVATWSAASALGAYLALNDANGEKEKLWTIVQGVDMDRRLRREINVQVQLTADGSGIEKIEVNGTTSLRLI